MLQLRWLHVNFFSHCARMVNVVATCLSMTVVAGNVLDLPGLEYMCIHHVPLSILVKVDRIRVLQIMLNHSCLGSDIMSAAAVGNTGTVSVSSLPAWIKHIW